MTGVADDVQELPVAQLDPAGTDRLLGELLGLPAAHLDRLRAVARPPRQDRPGAGRGRNRPADGAAEPTTVKGGIFSGMFRAPEPGEVLGDLGDKVVHALSKSVHLTREDLSEYRLIRPGWVSRASERGLASWIHDAMWLHLLEALDGIDGVAIKDKEPTREVTVGLRYRIRAKRHHQDGRVSTYPTQTALAFLEQEGRTMFIPSLEEINLIAGYEWDKESRDMGGALLSLRNGASNIIWVTDLPDVGDQGASGVVVQPTVPQPTGPKINVSGSIRRKRTEGETRQ